MNSADNRPRKRRIKPIIPSIHEIQKRSTKRMYLLIEIHEINAWQKPKLQRRAVNEYFTFNLKNFTNGQSNCNF